MSTTLTFKGQVTIPKQIRDALGLKPGMPVDFAVNHEGEAVIHGAKGSAKRKPDRFEVAHQGSYGGASQRCLMLVDTNVLVDVVERTILNGQTGRSDSCERNQGCTA
jgi:antitoxin PrlF